VLSLEASVRGCVRAGYEEDDEAAEVDVDGIGTRVERVSGRGEGGGASWNALVLSIEEVKGFVDESDTYAVSVLFWGVD